MQDGNVFEKNEKMWTKKIKENPWILATIVLAVVAVILIILVMRGGGGSSSVSIDKAGQSSVDLIGKVFGVTLAYDGGQELNGVYVLNFTLGNQSLQLESTKDFSFLSLPNGQWLRVADYANAPKANASSNPSSSSSAAAQEPVTKSDKPTVEAFVFSYCPYGLQFEKALFPAYDLLKNKADIKIVYIGAMHGPFEETESLRQLAILKNYGEDKLMAYLKLFDTNSSIGSCSGDSACLSPYLDSIFKQLGIDSAKINADMNSTSPSSYQTDEARASQLGVSGSPTFVINGAEVSVNRTPAAIEAAICSAFNTAPAECSQTLSTAATSPGFGADAGSSTGASCGTPTA